MLSTESSTFLSFNPSNGNRSGSSRKEGCTDVILVAAAVETSHSPSGNRREHRTIGEFEVAATFHQTGGWNRDSFLLETIYVFTPGACGTEGEREKKVNERQRWKRNGKRRRRRRRRRTANVEKEENEGERRQVKVENEKWEGEDKEKERDGELTDADPDLVTGTGDYNEKQSTE
ncbi:hypothetical protein K0M31_016215 [Melipona bicolor]|uniref:Uncharacterized protein n=1 Tax=Melipona bicolor TaxID=60889 RepID=A0AA40G6N7_9HYME|nr:hypothetical protein K0M31_016215 [Melipona bicolor]